MDKIKRMLSSRLKVNAMARTVSQDPLQSYKFRVTIAGLPTGAGFQKVSGLSRETEIAEYVEGGYNTIHKLQGREKVEDISLERGAFASTELYNIYKSQLTNDKFRQTVIIELMDKFGATKRTWKLGEAWISKWEGPEMDASSNDVAVEKLTITFEEYLD